jgi:hypothetical protein
MGDKRRKRAPLHLVRIIAYAFKQAEIYARLAEDTKIFQEKAEKKRVIYQQWYINFIFALCHFSPFTHFLSCRFETLT